MKIVESNGTDVFEACNPWFKGQYSNSTEAEVLEALEKIIEKEFPSIEWFSVTRGHYLGDKWDFTDCVSCSARAGNCEGYVANVHVFGRDMKVRTLATVKCWDAEEAEKIAVRMGRLLGSMQ